MATVRWQPVVSTPGCMPKICWILNRSRELAGYTQCLDSSHSVNDAGRYDVSRNNGQLSKKVLHEHIRETKVDVEVYRTPCASVQECGAVVKDAVLKAKIIEVGVYEADPPEVALLKEALARAHITECTERKRQGRYWLVPSNSWKTSTYSCARNDAHSWKSELQ